MMRLQEMLREEDEEGFNTAMRELSVIPRDEAIALLEELAHEPSGTFRCRAMDAMSKISPARAEALALQSLNDAEWFVRVNAIDILCQLGSRTAVHPIARLLATDPDDMVRSWAAFALGALGDESVIPALETCMQNDRGVDHEGQPIRSTAQRAIQKIRSRLAGKQ